MTKMKGASSQIREHILSGEELLFLLSSEQKQLEALKPMVNAVNELRDDVAATPDNDVAGMLLQTAVFLHRIGDRKGFDRLYALAQMAQPGGQKPPLEWGYTALIIVAHTALAPVFMYWKDATARILRDLPEVEMLLTGKPGREGNQATPATRLENLRRTFQKNRIKNKYAQVAYSVGLEEISKLRGDRDALDRLVKKLLADTKAFLQSFYSNPAKDP